MSVKPKALPQYIASGIICLGAWNFGSALAWISNITDDLRAGKLNGVKMGTAELGWVGSLCTLGATVMCLGSGVMADGIGRKWTCLLMTAPGILGWLLMTFAQNMAMVYVGNFFIGIAGGTFTIIAPLYTTEIAQIHIRGALGTCMQLYMGLGTIYSFVLGWALPMLWYNIANLLPLVIFAVLFIFQPETPFYYLLKGNEQAAAKSFKRLRGLDYDFTDEQSIMLREIEISRDFKDIRSAIKTKSAKKSIIICFSLMIFQKATGINAVVFFSKEIFIEAGTGIAPHFSVIVTGTFLLLGIITGVLTIDHFGRTLLLMISMLGCSIGTLFLAIFFTMKRYLDEDTVRSFGFLPVTSTIVFMFFFNVGVGAIPWLLCSELFSPELKAKMGAPAASFNWFLSFMVIKLYFPTTELIGVDGTFYFFTFMSALGFLFVLMIVPETKSKTFEQILPTLEKFWNF